MFPRLSQGSDRVRTTCLTVAALEGAGMTGGNVAWASGELVMLLSLDTWVVWLLKIH